MRKLYLPLLIVLVAIAATRAWAAISLCTITGQVFKADGSADANDVIWFTPNPATQTVAGGQVTAQPVSTTTDVNGNLAAITLAQGITVNVTELNGSSGPVTGCVPVTATATFISVISCSNVSTFTGITLNSLSPPTGNYSLAGFGLTNVGSLTGGSSLMSISGGAGGLSIKGTTTTNLDTLSHMSVNGVYNVVAYGADTTGTSDSYGAFQAAINAACANSSSLAISEVWIPPGTYKLLTPVVLLCKNNISLVGADEASVVLKPAYISTLQGKAGPVVVTSQNWIGSGNSTWVKSSLVGSTFNSLNFDNSDLPWLDFGEVLGYNRPLNGLAAFDVRFWFNVPTLNPSNSLGNLIIQSDSAADEAAGNAYTNCHGPTEAGGAPGRHCDGAFGVYIGTDGKVYSRLNVAGTVKKLNSGATTVLINTTHFFELSYDGSNVREILDGTLVATTAGSGTISQRVDETIMLGKEAQQWPNNTVANFAGVGLAQFIGQIDSFELSNVARSTCGGSTVVGASCYTNPTAKNTGDANSLVLLNFDQTLLPLTGPGANGLPIIEPTRVNGVAMDATHTAWLAFHNANLGCCSAPNSIWNITTSDGTVPIVDIAQQTDFENIHITNNNFNFGIETSQGSFNSILRNITVDGGTLPLDIIGGLSNARDMSLVCQGACAVWGGNSTVSDTFLLPASQNLWGVIAEIGSSGSGTTLNNVQFDSENGGKYVPFICGTSGSMSIINSVAVPQGAASPYRIEGGCQGLTVMGGAFLGATAIQPVVDMLGATSQNRQISFHGVNTNNGKGTDLPAGANWLNADASSVVELTNLDVWPYAEGSTSVVYHATAQLSHLGPDVGGIADSGKITTTVLAVPAAPTVTVVGTAGVTSYTYFCVGHDAAGGTTPASAGTTITTGNASLSTTNYNQISCGPEAGMVNWDILRADTAHSIYTAQVGVSVTVTDQQNGAGSGYTNPGRNSTADVALAANATIAQVEGTAPTGVASSDLLYADSTAHAWKVNNNNGGALQLPATSNGVVEFNISTSGLLGGLTSTAAATLLQACDVAVSAGHFTNLVIVNDLNGGACTTAPTYNIRDDTGSTTGTALAGSTTAGQVTQAETLAFAAGDRICLVRTVNGGTCTVPTFTVIAHVKEP